MRANERASASRATAALRLWLFETAFCSYCESSGSAKRLHQIPFGIESFGVACRQGEGACQFCGISTVGFSYFGERAKTAEEHSTSARIGTLRLTLRSRLGAPQPAARPPASHWDSARSDLRLQSRSRPRHPDRSRVQY